MTPLSNKQVWEKIREIRESGNITQQEIADHLGMTKSSYAKHERGERKNLDRELIIKVARYLDCSISKIYRFDEEYQNTDSHNVKITPEYLNDKHRILLSHFGELGDDEQQFFLKQIERAARERNENYD